jgi:hypothetical protein
MILLLSPLTWGQHCVGVIPALYLILRDAFFRREFPKPAAIVLGAYCVLILVLNRGLIGKEGTYLLDSYYTTTWCLGALLWLVLRTHRKNDPQPRNPRSCASDIIRVISPRYETPPDVTSLPSLMVSTRSAFAAASESWVTIKTAPPEAANSAR